MSGTERPDHFKWLLTLRVGIPEQVFGYAGPRFMELTQRFHHFTHGTYLAYAAPRTMKRGKSLFALGPLDRGVARAATAYLHALVRHPSLPFRNLPMQSVMIIQPADMMVNGALSMCDGCPDITVHDDRLVWSCRMEELMNFGDWIRPVPTTDATPTS